MKKILGFTMFLSMLTAVAAPLVSSAAPMANTSTNRQTLKIDKMVVKDQNCTTGASCVQQIAVDFIYRNIDNVVFNLRKNGSYFRTINTAGQHWDRNLISVDANNIATWRGTFVLTIPKGIPAGEYELVIVSGNGVVRDTRPVTVK